MATKNCPIHGTPMDKGYDSQGVYYWCWDGNREWNARTIQEYKENERNPTTSGFRPLENDL